MATTILDFVTAETTALAAYSDHFGEMRCSDLEVPLISTEFFLPILKSYLNSITREEWTIMSKGMITGKTLNLVAKMCNELVDKTIMTVLNVVGPQVIDWKIDCCPIDASLPRSSRNYETVTDEDIQAATADSFGQSLAVLLDVEEGLPQSDRLVSLLSARVRQELNGALAHIDVMLSREKRPGKVEDSPQLGQLPGQVEDPTEPVQGQEDATDPAHYEMVCLLAQILISMKSRDSQTASPQEQEPESPAYEECRDSNWSECQGTKNKENSTQTDSAFYDKVETTKVVTFREQTQNEVRPIPQLGERSASCAEEQVLTFLMVFIPKLVKCITKATKTPLFIVDIEGIVARVGRQIREKPSLILPLTVGEIHNRVFKKLCSEFGSAQLLQVAMLSKDKAFDEAVVKTLEGQLQKNTDNTSSFGKNVKVRVKVSAKKNSQVSTTCEVTFIEDFHYEDTDEINTPREKKKRPAIVRMFSSFANFLRKSCTMCISGSSEDVFD